MSHKDSLFWRTAVLRAFLGLAVVCVLCFACAIGVGAQEIVAIAAGSPAQSNSSGGDYPFVADEYFVGGGDNAPVMATINLSQPGVNAAPMAVYQHGRAGAFTYTIPGLTAGSTYSVLLHFAETYFSASGGREFNVSINGTTVLTNLDVYATVGKNAALLETFTATANSSGQIVIAFTVGAKDQPLVMGIEVRSTSAPNCNTVPSAPTGLTATASSSSVISVGWTAVTPPANCTITSYSVYRSTTSGFTPSGSTLVASGLTSPTYSNTGLGASTTYYFVVEALDAAGTSAASAQAHATTSAASCTAVPSAPTGLTATASSSSAINVTWTAVAPPANCTIGSYSVYRSTTGGFTPGSGNLVASGLTATSYSNTGLSASTTYYYIVEAVDAFGTSAASAQGSATTQAAGTGTEVVAIAAGGPAESNSGGGDYSFAADEDFLGGGANSPVTATINLTQPGANAAPMAVYQNGRAGVSTYTIPGLTSGGTYTVLLHFAETYFSAAAGREFNVAINGTTVLTNLDVYATVGKNAALVETFTATANSSGQIVIAFTVGAKDQPLVMGIEIRSTSAPSCTIVPSAPTGLTATASSSSVISLSWTAVTPPANCTISSYSVYRSTTSGFTPSGSTLVASGLTSPTYSNTGLAASTKYYFIVESLDAAGTSGASAQATATTQSGASCTTVPAAPTGLVATASSSSVIGVSWNAVTPPANCTISSYSVYGGTTANPTTLIAGGLTGTTYSNSGLAASTTYYYIVKALDAYGTSAASPQATATTPASSAPAPPTNLTAVGSSSQQIDLRWVASATPAPNTAPVNYLVYRSTTSPFTPSAANLLGSTIGITNYLDSNYPATLSPPAGPGIRPSTTYYYQVVASTPSGTSTAASASATSLPATPSSASPAALTGLTAMAENANEIDLVWNSTNSGVGTVVTTYYIYRSTTFPFTPSASNNIGTTKSNWFQDALCTASTPYYYQVLASNSIGSSPSSATVTATTPALNPDLWGGAPFWDASNMPALPAGDTVMMKFLNRTNGMFADDQIIWTATINGVASQYTVAQQPTFAMPPNSAGRMYFYLNDPTLAQNNTDYWDFIEFTAGPTSINMDTTRVDAFGVKIAFNLTCGDGTNIALGENEETFAEDRSVTFQRYLDAVPATPGGDFQSDAIYAPYRIIEPGGAGFNAGGADQNYYQTYISDIWSFNGITIPLAGPNGSGLGANPDLSAAIFRHTAPISGTPEFNSAGDLTNQGMWGNPASFYQQEPYDHYAQWIEAQAINMQQYAFPYNDAGGYSSDIGCSGPKTLLIAIGW
jgi:trimeric autotransporter adhesin